MGRGQFPAFPNRRAAMGRRTSGGLSGRENPDQIGTHRRMLVKFNQLIAQQPNGCSNNLKAVISKITNSEEAIESPHQRDAKPSAQVEGT